MRIPALSHPEGRRWEQAEGRPPAGSLWGRKGESGTLMSFTWGENNPNSPHIILFESGIIIPAYGECACGHACLEHMAGGGQSSPCRLGCQEALEIACFWLFGTGITSNLHQHTTRPFLVSGLAWPQLHRRWHEGFLSPERWDYWALMIEARSSRWQGKNFND